MYGIGARELEIVVMMAHTLVLDDAVWEAAVAAGVFDTSQDLAEARIKLHALVDQVGSMLMMAGAMADALDRLSGKNGQAGDAVPDFIPESEGWSL